jgi:hypothetical protein
MTATFRKLVLAAVVASTFPAAALACDRDHDDRDYDDRRAGPPAPFYSPAPWTPPAPDPGWRETSPRRHELREVRAELRALEQARADFYARWGGHPRKVARFERWYGLRHAELERRWHALQRYAWR